MRRPDALSQLQRLLTVSSAMEKVSGIERSYSLPYSSSSSASFSFRAMHSCNIVCYLLAVPLAYATPLHLLSPPQAPSILTSPPFIVNTTTSIPDQCYEPKPGRLPTTFRDCQHAASQINPDHETKSFTFGRPFSLLPNYIELPKSYRHGTCIVYLDMAHDTDQDSLTLLEVGRGTLHLAQECIGQQAESALRLGGIMSVGPRKLLYIVMFGRQDQVAAADA